MSNPYRAGDTVYWSKTRYDEAGRSVESYAPAELANLANAQSLGVTSFGISTVSNYIGTVVTTTDASLRKSRSITNALGQLIRVDEPTGIGGTVCPQKVSCAPKGQACEIAHFRINLSEDINGILMYRSNNNDDCDSRWNVRYCR